MRKPSLPHYSPVKPLDISIFDNKDEDTAFIEVEEPTKLLKEKSLRSTLVRVVLTFNLALYTRSQLLHVYEPVHLWYQVSHILRLLIRMLETFQSHPRVH